MAKMSPSEIKNLSRKVLSEKPSTVGNDPVPGDIQEMSIRPDQLNGQAGFMAEHRMQPKPGKPDDPPPAKGSASEKNFFNKGDAEGLGNHVKKVFGGKK
jgi:hypothetical protein